MQLTQFTDYALRTLIYIAVRDGDVCTITEIADSYRISKNHLMKVAHRLGQLNVLKTIRGKHGGLLLNTTPELINIGHLVKQLENNFFIVECFDQSKKSCRIAPVCKLKHILQEAKDNFFQTLEQYTLKDIVKNQVELSHILLKNKNRH